MRVWQGASYSNTQTSKWGPPKVCVPCHDWARRSGCANPPDSKGLNWKAEKLDVSISIELFWNYTSLGPDVVYFVESMTSLVVKAPLFMYHCGSSTACLARAPCCPVTRHLLFALQEVWNGCHSSTTSTCFTDNSVTPWHSASRSFCRWNDFLFHWQI